MIKSNPKKKPCLELDDLTALKNTPKKKISIIIKKNK